MKIFEVKPTYDERGNDKFRGIAPVGGVDWRRGAWRFDGSRVSSEWEPDGALVRVVNPRAASGDFLFPPVLSVFAMTQRAARLLSPVAESVGEMLPLRTPDGERLYFLNITPLVDCIDTTRTKGERLENGYYFLMENVAFVTAKLPRRSLFSARHHHSIYALQGTVPDRLDFKLAVEAHGLQGLTFREVWNDDGDPVETSSGRRSAR